MKNQFEKQEDRDYEIGARSGLLTGEHFHRLGLALWGFEFYIDRQTDKEGTVLFGLPLTNKMLEEMTGIPARTWRTMNAIMKKENYVIFTRAQYGSCTKIANPKKWSRKWQNKIDDLRLSGDFRLTQNVNLKSENDDLRLSEPPQNDDLRHQSDAQRLSRKILEVVSPNEIAGSEGVEKPLRQEKTRSKKDKRETRARANPSLSNKSNENGNTHTFDTVPSPLSPERFREVARELGYEAIVEPWVIRFVTMSQGDAQRRKQIEQLYTAPKDVLKKAMDTALTNWIKRKKKKERVSLPMALDNMVDDVVFDMSMGQDIDQKKLEGFFKSEDILREAREQEDYNEQRRLELQAAEVRKAYGISREERNEMRLKHE